jgi:hypothetical protein
MSVEEVRQRWARFNVFGEGKDHSTKLGATVWYRREILFYYDNPAARIFKFGSKFAAITKPGSGVYAGQGTGVDKNEGRVWDLGMFAPCIGVFSHYEGDFMDAETTHNRNRWLWSKQYGEARQSMYDHRAMDFADKPDQFVTSLIKKLNGINESRMRYSKFFALGWDNYDVESLRSEISLHYHEHADLFNMPSAVAKRERALARRTAKKAFGVT